MVMYNQNDEVVNSIIRRKTQLGLSRPHSDVPDDENMRLYYVPRSSPLLLHEAVTRKHTI